MHKLHQGSVFQILSKMQRYYQVVNITKCQKVIIISMEFRLILFIDTVYLYHFFILFAILLQNFFAYYQPSSLGVKFGHWKRKHYW